MLCILLVYQTPESVSSLRLAVNMIQCLFHSEEFAGCG